MLLAEAISTAGFTTFSAATGSEAQRLFAAKDPDGVVLDVDLGHGLNGFDLCDAFVKHNPNIAVVFLTQLPDSRFMSRSPKSLPATAAYLRKDQLSDKRFLIDALDAALRGEVPTEHHHDRHADRPLTGLSRTQLDVMIMVSRGMTTSEIARTRGTNVRTVQKDIIRSLDIMHIDANLDQSVRMRAVREFLTAFDAASPAD
jgi:DNA-binding NarL/FixJ family response regulator